MFGVVATGWLLHTVHATPMAQPGLTKTLFALGLRRGGVGLGAGLTGAALRFLSNYSAVRRYIADASYWIYLAHLPVVAALAVWVGHWPLHWGVKYPFILVMSFAVLFLSYHFLVRPSVHRPAAQWPQVSARKRRRLPHVRAATPRLPQPWKRRRAWPRCAASPRSSATPPHSPASTSKLRRGELLAVLGPNGAGKTTAIALWLGLIEADGGEVTLLGGSPQDVERRRGLGVMMQDVEMYKELRVRELIDARFELLHATRCRSMRRCVAPASTQLADRRYGKLSGGQKRQAQFAVAICGRPQVLFLDEPTVGLDMQAREALWPNVRPLLAEGCSDRADDALPGRSRGAGHARGRAWPRDASSPPAASTTCARWWRAGRSAAKRTLTPKTVRGWPGVIEAQRVQAIACTSSPPTRRPWCGGCSPPIPT